MTPKDFSSQKLQKPRLWKYIVSALLPVLSLLIFAIAVNVQTTTPTGLAILVPQPMEQVDAKLSIVISDQEFIPLESYVQIRYNGQMNSLSLEHLLSLQQVQPSFLVDENAKINYRGIGIKGPYTLKFALSDFALDRQVSSESIELTLLYKTQVLSRTVAKLT